MIRLLAVTALLATIAAAPSLAAPRPIDPPAVSAGVYRFEFYEADGFDAHRITVQRYIALVDAHACGPHSAVTRYPTQRLIQAVCEVGE